MQTTEVVDNLVWKPLEQYWKERGFLEEGWERVNLEKPNFGPGTNIVSGKGLFGTLASITPSGKYSVRYDVDYAGEPRTYFSKESFAEFFLIDARKK